MSWKDSVNQAIGSARITNISAYSNAVGSLNGNPIDRFYESLRNLNTIGTTQFLASHPSIGPLIFLGHISATENYLREIFAFILRSCGVAKKAAADHGVKWGSILWHRSGTIEMAAFEHLSFAGEAEIKKACKNFLSFQINDASPLASPLSEFNQLCELRHSVVHSNGYLAGKNAIALNLPPVTGLLQVRMDYPQLQEAAWICTSLVTSFNAELFTLMANRWAREWRRMPDWNATDEDRLFEEIFNEFRSATDRTNNTIPHLLSHDQCREDVKRDLGLV